VIWPESCDALALQVFVIDHIEEESQLMKCLEHSSAALAALLSVSFAACAGVEPASEPGDNSSTLSTPGAGAVTPAAVTRAALTRDPREYSNKELMARGYRPRPDAATMPAAYAAWLENASKPMKVITPITSESDMDNPGDTGNTWSGIVNNTPNGGYTYVEGQWTVPAVTVDPGVNTYSSAWVGLDGWINSGAELWQAGTAQQIDANGNPSYYAWFQMYPHQREQRLMNFEVSPGDVITAAVAIQDSDGSFTNAGQIPVYWLSNETTGMMTGWREWGSVAPGQVAGDSVEWIMERPTKVAHVPASLANFGGIRFDNMVYLDDAGYQAGIDYSTSLTVDMVNRDDNNMLSQAFELSNSSASVLFYAPN
jgi:hypothetical protein